jgi:hypothetical protein
MWNPPPNVTEHTGAPLTADLDFFVAPPAEIGTIRSAHTSLKKGVRERPVPLRTLFALVGGAVGYLLTWGFDSLTKILFVVADITRTPLILWYLIFIPLWVYLGWRASGFLHSCTFAGDYGCAHFQCEHERTKVTRMSYFRFQDASAVSTRIVRRTKNGVYNGTNFYFHWYSSDSKYVIYSITGSHHKDSKTPPPENFYNFACAVESAWYRYATPKIDAEFAQNGSVRFYMGYNCWSVLGRGYIQFVDEHGKVSRCDAEEIGSAKLFDGRLTIRHKEAKRKFFDLFNSEGVFGFPYGAIHNARLFLYLFEKSLGIRVQ